MSSTQPKEELLSTIPLPERTKPLDMPKRKAADVVSNGDMLTQAKKSKSNTKPTKPCTAVEVETPKYTSQQERSIQEYAHITRADKSSAARALKQAGWNVTNAVNSFFSSTANSGPARTKVSQIFDSYREDPKDLPNEINFEGAGRLLNDLGINVEDVGALYLFEVVHSPQLGKITREGFIDGFANAGADNTAKMRNVVLSRQAQLPDDLTIFKNVYNHTFTLLIEDRKKAVDLEQAIDFWRLLLSDNGFDWNSGDIPWLDWYIDFMTTKYKRPINKDLWKQTLAFAEATRKDPTLGFWNEESSWPSVIDDFVQYVKDEKRTGGDAMEIE